MNWYSARHLFHEDRLIKLHQIRIDFRQQNIPVSSELHETFQSTGIIFSRAYLAHLFETGYDALHEIEKRLSLCIALKGSYNIICRISDFPVIKLSDNHVQPLQIPFHAFLQGKEQIASFRTTDNDTASSFVPFIRKYPVIRL